MNQVQTIPTNHPLQLTQFDLSPLMPPVYNQGQLGSCTSNAVSAAIQYQRSASNKRDIVPSRLFTYFNSRRITKTQNKDDGATTSNVLLGIERHGYVAENRSRYNVENFTVKPSGKNYRVAQRFKVQYSQLTVSEDSIESSILSGKPVIASFVTCPALYTLGNDVLQIPTVNTTGIGHTVLITGFNDTEKTFTFRNSWGTSWGNKGYGRMAYDYLLSPGVAYDFNRIDKA